MKHTEYMEHYFKQKDPVIINVRRKMWSPRGSGWILKGIFATFVNVAQYERFREVSYFSSCYFSLQKSYKIRKQSSKSKTETTSVRWALRAALFPA